MAGEHRGEIEVIARGVCVSAGRVLLCHSKGASNTYLPGGHVEFKEAAADALAREIGEELGLGCSVGRFLGAAEHSFRQQGKRHCEVNLVFQMRIPGVAPGVSPRAREAGIDFRWHPLGALSSSRLEPAPLRRLLPAWLRRGCPSWASTYAAGES